MNEPPKLTAESLMAEVLADLANMTDEQRKRLFNPPRSIVIDEEILDAILHDVPEPHRGEVRKRIMRFSWG